MSTISLDQPTTSFRHLFHVYSPLNLRRHLGFVPTSPFSLSIDKIHYQLLTTLAHPAFWYLNRVFKYSNAITAKIRRCVSLEHLMITTCKSPNFNSSPWLPMYSKTQYTGNPFLYPAMQSKPIQLFPPNNSQTRSQTSSIFGKFIVSFTIIIFPPPSFRWLNHC